MSLKAAARSEWLRRLHTCDALRGEFFSAPLTGRRASLGTVTKRWSPWACGHGFMKWVGGQALLAPVVEPFGSPVLRRCCGAGVRSWHMAGIFGVSNRDSYRRV